MSEPVHRTARDADRARDFISARRFDGARSVEAAQTEKARKQEEKLQAKIDAAKRALDEKEQRLAASDAKARLEQRLSDLRVEYDGRTQRLQDALNRQRAAHATSAA